VILFSRHDEQQAIVESPMPPRKSTTTYRKSNYYHDKTYWPTRQMYTPTATYPCNSPKYKWVQQECQWRIGSYRNVYSQFTGAGTKTNISPATANKWMKYVNHGAMVYKFTNKDFCRYFGNRWAYSTSRAAYQYLKNHYGTAIKDVTRGKGNCWLIATTRTPASRPFNNYNWR
jgi:hypothetical protein